MEIQIWRTHALALAFALLLITLITVESRRSFYSSFTGLSFVTHDNLLVSPPKDRPQEKRAVDEDGCLYACVRTPWCVSINVNHTAITKGGGPACQLLSIDKFYSKRHVQNKTGIKHFSIAKSSCESLPCKNNGSCVSLYDRQDFKCECVPGWKEKTCSKEIPTFLDVLSSSIFENHGNTSYFEALIGFVKTNSDQKNESASGWKKCFWLERDGMNDTAFHSGCDKKSVTITIARVGKYIFGGYSDKPWGEGKWIKSNHSFIFSLFNIYGFNPLKLSLNKSVNPLAYSNFGGILGAEPGYGPVFGSDLIFSLGTKDKSFASPSIYDLPPTCTYSYAEVCGTCCKFYTGVYLFNLDDLEVFYQLPPRLDSSILKNERDVYAQALLEYLDSVKTSSTSRWLKCWRATTDGWSSASFRSGCNGRGPSVTIVRVGKMVFGGYTDVPWTNVPGYRSSSKSFLFTLYNTNGLDPQKTAIKLQNTAVEHQPSTSAAGPIFGVGPDLGIYLNTDRVSKTGNVISYQAPRGCTYGMPCALWASTVTFKPDEVEVLVEVEFN